MSYPERVIQGVIFRQRLGRYSLYAATPLLFTNIFLGRETNQQFQVVNRQQPLESGR
jgi:hypothetical protein